MIPIFFKLLVEKFYQYLVLAIVSIIAIVALRHSGTKSEKARNIKANTDAMQKRNDIQNDINGQPDRDVHRELHEDWRRD